ncbi:small VCP/p97-interacting protein [Centruroides vittatus]|uniref:small VCP/p97-interacting protein-like n=1 Tax=Centruroides sculpturatus TaxID=218467 RepID=UPI000C6D7945|nr:small VCP/p97-interacting protein-like [Centruroides sculpturatus]
MGFCLSCCENNSKSYEDVRSSSDAALHREQMAAAAERRIREQESRGIKDVEKVKQLQQRHNEREKMLDNMPERDNPLRWQVG